MKLRVENTEIPGCQFLCPQIAEDERGKFLKAFHAPTFAGLGLESDFPEEFFSWSNAGVIRGLHFQLPPDDHAKTVLCLEGAAFDVVLDLRVGSPSYGKVVTFMLEASVPRILYIPKGCAHGFCALKDSTLLFYRVTTVHAPANDTGIRWDSVAIPWPVKDPILSDRDRSFLPLSEFISPFRFEGQER